MLQMPTFNYPNIKFRPNAKSTFQQALAFGLENGVASTDVFPEASSDSLLADADIA